MKVLMSTDLHETLRPDDEYRWEFFQDFAAIAKDYEVDKIILLGDLTHDKDNHSAKLVNRLTEKLVMISYIAPVIIIKGNHDYVDSSFPYMMFLNNFSQSIEFIVNPISVSLDGKESLLLPHTKAPLTKRFDYDYVFMHQTIGGAVVSNGMKMSGPLTKFTFKDAGKVFSGDVHVPQKLGNVLYVGSPYHINFGDCFAPRLILLDTEKDTVKSIPYENAPRKISVVISDPDELDLFDGARPGDYMKVRVSMSRADFPNWRVVRKGVLKRMDKLGVISRGVDLVEMKRTVLRKKSSVVDSVDNDKYHELSDYDAIAKFSRGEHLQPELIEFGEDLL